MVVRGDESGGQMYFVLVLKLRWILYMCAISFTVITKLIIITIIMEQSLNR